MSLYGRCKYERICVFFIYFFSINVYGDDWFVEVERVIVLGSEF